MILRQPTLTRRVEVCQCRVMGPLRATYEAQDEPVCKGCDLVNVLITGGAGFIGSELGKFLVKRGHVVRLLDNLEYGYRANFEDNSHLKGSFILRDVRPPWDAAMLKDVDVVFHLAGISSLPECEINPGKAFDVNCTAVASLLSACRMSHVKRFIFASTSAVYENESSHGPFSEELRVAPNLVYATTKYCDLQTLQCIWAASGL